MEFKVSSIDASNKVIKITNDKVNFISEEILFSKSSLIGRVVERLAGSNEYLLNFSGKQMRLQSEAKLIPSEILNLKVKKDSMQVQLEISGRSRSLKEVSYPIENVWTKNYFSPGQIIDKAFESKQVDVSPQKIFQLLDVFFPGIEWRGETPYFDWKFQDGKAEGFYGREKDSFGFYFHFQSTNLGSVDSYLSWKSTDLSDLTVHCVFDKLAVYLAANEKLPELKKILNSNSIAADNIIFHFSTIHKTAGDWIA